MYIIYLVGCTHGYMGIYAIYRYSCGLESKARIYLLELEANGIIDGMIYHNIANAIQYAFTSRHDALAYYNLAIDNYYMPSYIAMFDEHWNGWKGCTINKTRAISILFEAEQKGMVEARILDKIIYALCSTYEPSQEMLGKFTTKMDMILHYCDLLIQHKSPLGYIRKGDLYLHGLGGIKKDVQQAITTWMEADTMGLASIEIYRNLVNVFK